MWRNVCQTNVPESSRKPLMRQKASRYLLLQSLAGEDCRPSLNASSWVSGGAPALINGETALCSFLSKDDYFSRRHGMFKEVHPLCPPKHCRARYGRHRGRGCSFLNTRDTCQFTQCKCSFPPLQPHLLPSSSPILATIITPCTPSSSLFRSSSSSTITISISATMSLYPNTQRLMGISPFWRVLIIVYHNGPPSTACLVWHPCGSQLGPDQIPSGCEPMTMHVSTLGRKNHSAI